MKRNHNIVYLLLSKCCTNIAYIYFKMLIVFVVNYFIFFRYRMKLKQQKVKRRNVQKPKKETRLNKKSEFLPQPLRGDGELEYEHLKKVLEV